MVAGNNDSIIYAGVINKNIYFRKKTVYILRYVRVNKPQLHLS